MSKTIEVNYVKFTEEQDTELNKVTTARNWGNHIPVSLIHSIKSRAYGETLNPKYPICLAYFTKYQGEWLVSLYVEHYDIYTKYQELYRLLKQDYEALTGHPCLIIKATQKVRNISDLKIPEASYNIQIKKFKTIEDIKKLYS